MAWDGKHRPLEHYCTLFDHAYLPLGMALHRSLVCTAGDFQLWVLCMDEQVEDALRVLQLERVRLIPLRDLERRFPALADARRGRTHGEYCWTTTPFLPEMVLHLDPDASRVTYVDADLYFFGSPRSILEELDRSGAKVLITEHAYPPDADNTESAGRFNVQFIPFVRSDKAFEILADWQSQCLGLCTNDSSSGFYGDQKYLDVWPERFGDAVHCLTDVGLTLGPWNVRHLWASGAPRGSYHFSGLRIFAGGEAMLFPSAHPFVIPFRAMLRIYVPYVHALSETWETCRRFGVLPKLPPAPRKSFFLVRRLGRLLLRIQWWVRIDRSLWRSFLGWTPFSG